MKIALVVGGAAISAICLQIGAGVAQTDMPSLIQFEVESKNHNGALCSHGDQIRFREGRSYYTQRYIQCGAKRTSMGGDQGFSFQIGKTTRQKIRCTIKRGSSSEICSDGDRIRRSTAAQQDAAFVKDFKSTASLSGNVYRQSYKFVTHGTENGQRYSTPRTHDLEIRISGKRCSVTKFHAQVQYANATYTNQLNRSVKCTVKY